MHALLAKLLRQRNIQNIEELDNEEKKQLNDWQRVLSSEPITVEKIKQFCQNQVRTIEGQWKNLDNTKNKNERLVLLHTVYKAMIDAIEAPDRERENYEKYLTSLLSS